MQFQAIPTSALAVAVPYFLVGAVGNAFGQKCPLEITYPAPLNSNAASDNGKDGRLQFTTDAVGNWGAVWQVVEIDEGTGEAHSAILFARSTDNGANWTEASLISSATPTGGHVNWTPQISRDGGIWIASWSSNDDLGGTIGDDGDILFVRSTDGGASWAEPQPLNANAAFDEGADSSVRIFPDGEANWVAVWRSTDDLEGTIGGDWDLLYARSTDGALSWTDPRPLSSNAGVDSALDYTFTLLTDGQGNWVAAWTSEDDLGGTIGEDRDILFARSTDGGANWSDVQPLNSNAAVDIRSDSSVWLGTDGMGVLVAAWNSADDVGGTVGEDWDILFARSTDGGTSWTEVEPLNSNATIDSGNDISVKLATDGVGTWLAIWVSSDDLGGTIGNDSDILFARSTDAGVS